MIWSKKKQFLVIFFAFLVLGASFKVMTLIPGLTEVRPVNAIPMVAGLLFGPMGALGCGIGNLAADLFGTFDSTSILGLVANFVAAFLPYRLWHIFSKEEPNVHTWKNILFYIGLTAISALTVAYLIAFGLEVIFGFWIKTLYLYILYNDLGFPIFLGMPVFIVLTSKDIQIKCAAPIRSFVPERLRRFRIAALILFVLCMLAMLLGVCFNLSMLSSIWMMITGILAGILLIFILI